MKKSAYEISEESDISLKDTKPKHERSRVGVQGPVLCSLGSLFPPGMHWQCKCTQLWAAEIAAEQMYDLKIETKHRFPTP